MRKREAGLLKESMTKKEREPYTTYHEAGHVAIAHVLGIEYGSVTIIPDAVGRVCLDRRLNFLAISNLPAHAKITFNPDHPMGDVQCKRSSNGQPHHSTRLTGPLRSSISTWTPET